MVIFNQFEDRNKCTIIILISNINIFLQKKMIKIILSINDCCEDVLFTQSLYC